MLLSIVFLRFVLYKQEANRLKSNFWFLFFLFFLFALISATMSDYQETAFNDVRKMLTVFVFFFLSLAVITDEHFKKTLPSVFIWSISIASLFSIVGYFFKIPLLVMDAGEKTLERGVGLSNDPNFFSSMIIFVIPFIINRLFGRYNVKTKVMAFFFLGINLGALVLTYSRAGVLIFTFIIIASLLIYRHKVKIRQIGFFLLFFVLVLIVVKVTIPDKFWQRQLNLYETSDQSLSRRLTYLYVGWDAFIHNPLVGTGPGTFNELYARSKYVAAYIEETGEREYIEYYRDAHNSYVEIMTGMGAGGLLTILLIFGLVVRNYRKSIREFLSTGDSEHALLAKTYLISFISQAMFYLFLSFVYQKYIWLLMALSQVALHAVRTQNVKEGA
ncbi:MAG: O-antigen ligase family protein [Nitrospirae bacterium]|nr:O-antigen ligase family protein [Nitrospirota bacterium]